MTSYSSKPIGFTQPKVPNAVYPERLSLSNEQRAGNSPLLTTSTCQNLVVDQTQARMPAVLPLELGIAKPHCPLLSVSSQAWP